MQEYYREGVIVKKKGENDVYADIISNSGRLYKVCIRGSKNDVITINKKDLLFLSGFNTDSDYARIEAVRKNLFHHRNDNSEMLQQWHGLLMGETFYYILWKNIDPKNLVALPRKIADTAFVRLVESHFFSAEQWMTPVRNFTSYNKALQPFLIVNDINGSIAKIDVNPALLCGATAQSFYENLVVEDLPNAAKLFLRAFAYGQYRLDTRQAGCPLSDAFFVLFFTIKMITRKSSMERINAYDFASDICSIFDEHGYRFRDGSEERKINADDFLWCLCALFLNICLVTRNNIPGNIKYNLILPNPYDDTVIEQVNIAYVLIKSREGHPLSYSRSFNMVMDVKDLFRPPFLPTKAMQLAFQFSILGKEVAFQSNNLKYMYEFLITETFWVPTSLWPINNVITYKDIRGRWKEAKKYKKQFELEIGDDSIGGLSVKQYKDGQQAFLESLEHSGCISLSDDDFPISCIRFEPYSYCTYRFTGTPYFQPGGKYDKMIEKKYCENCQKEIDRFHVRKCGGCKQAIYCNRDCQKKHWKVHKKLCKSISKKEG